MTGHAGENEVFCRDCGEAISEKAEICPNCGIRQQDPPKPEPEGPDWQPKFPITSVFLSILLLWSTLEYSNVGSTVLFGVPGVLIIPRVRRAITRLVRQRFGTDLAREGIMAAIGMVYAVLFLLGVMSVIGSTGNDPTIAGPPSRQLAIGVLTMVIMYGLAAAIVFAVRFGRTLRPESSSSPAEGDELNARRGDVESEQSTESEGDSRGVVALFRSKTQGVDWWSGIQIFVGATVFLVGVGIVIQSPLGVPILLVGLTIIPGARNWGMDKLGGSDD